MENIFIRVVCVLLVTSCALHRANGEPISALRLIAPTRPNSGLLEVYSPALQGWGLVCNEGQGFAFAAAACYNYLNFPGTARLFSNSPDLTALGSIDIFSCDVSSENGTIHCSRLDGTCSPSNVLAVTCKGPGYLGCFVDYTTWIESYRVLREGPDQSDLNTVSTCLASCAEQGYFYAGVENSDECFCGVQNDSYAAQGDATDSECSYLCSGDEEDTCGASKRIAIYQVDLGVCEDPGPPAMGMRIGDSFRYGDVVQFKCSNGYVLEGDHSLQCIQAYSASDPMTITEGATHRVTRQMWRRSLWQGYHRNVPRRSHQRSATSGSELRRDSGAWWGARSDSSAQGVRRRRSEDRHAVKWNGTVPVCRFLAPSTFGPSTVSETAASSKPTGLPHPSTATPNPKSRDGTGEPLADKRSYIYAGAGVAICLILGIIVVIVVVIRKRRGKVREIDNNHTDNSRQRDPGIDDEGAIGHQGADTSASLNLLSASEQPSARENLYSEDNPGDGEVDAEHNYAYADPGRAGLLSSPIDSPLSHEYFALQTRQGDIAMDSDHPTRTGMDSSLQIQRDLATPSTDVYANTEFHEVPSDSDMVTNELYGS